MIVFQVLVLVAAVAASIVAVAAAADDSDAMSELHPQQCSHDLDTKGFTVPHGDIGIVEGGNRPLQIDCRLSDSAMNELGANASSLLSFSLNYVPVSDRRLVRQLNDSTIRLEISNLTANRYFVICNFNRTELVCINYVLVGAPPKPVLDFGCIGDNFERFTCHWKDSQPSYMENHFDLFYAQGRNKYPCSQNIRKINDTYSCSWSFYDDTFYRIVLPVFEMHMVVSNLLGQKATRYMIDHFRNVRSSPAYDFLATNRTPTSIELGWKVPSHMKSYPGGMIASISYKSECAATSDWTTVFSDVLPIHLPSFRMRIDDLAYSYVLYDFRIRLTLAINTSAEYLRFNKTVLWSNFTSITARTLARLPMQPQVISNAFEVHMDSPIERSIFVYWQRVLHCFQNGPDFRYKISVYNQQKTQRQLIVKNETTSSYLLISNLDLDSTYFLRISAANSIGESNDSEIHVLPETQITKVPEDFIVVLGMGNNRYEISWRNISGTENYTVFWCNHERMRTEAAHCNGLLEWRTVSRYVTAVNVTVDTNNTYEFGVAANNRSHTTGLVWSQCTVWEVNTASRITNIWFNQVGARTLSIHWHLSCAERIGLPERINVTYCAIVSPDDHRCRERSEQQLSFTNAHRLQSLFLADLSPYTTYKIHVRFITKHGHVLYSDPLFNTTLEAAPSGPLFFRILPNSINESAVRVEWQKPSVTNGLIRHYKVHLLDSSFTHLKTDLIANNTDLRLNSNQNQTIYSHVIGNLTSYFAYYVRVSACTIDCLDSKSVQFWTKMSRPSKMLRPHLIVNESLITIEWQRPNPPNGPIHLYELTIRYLGSQLAEVFNITMTNSSAFRTSNLIQDRCDRVEIQIRACNIFVDDDFHRYSVDEANHGESREPTQQRFVPHHDLLIIGSLDNDDKNSYLAANPDTTDETHTAFLTKTEPQESRMTDVNSRFRPEESRLESRQVRHLPTPLQDFADHKQYLYGDWSEVSSANLCDEQLVSSRLYNYFAAVLFVVLLPVLVFVSWRTYKKFQRMHNVTVKLPMIGLSTFSSNGEKLSFESTDDDTAGSTPTEPATVSVSDTSTADLGQKTTTATSLM